MSQRNDDRASTEAPFEADRGPPGQWRLMAPALLCWAVTAVSLTAPGSAGLVALIAACSGAVVLTGLMLAGRELVARAFAGRVFASTELWRTSAALLLITCAALLFVGLRVTQAEAARADPALTESAEIGNSVHVVARLAGYPEQRASVSRSYAWVRAEIQATSGPVPVIMWLPDGEPPAHWSPGLLIEATGTLERQPPADAAAFTMRVRAIEDHPNQAISAALGATAATIRASLVQQASEVPGAELVPGFAVGDTTLVSEELEANMLESSLTHLVAVSGSNTGLVIAAAVWASSWLGLGRRSRVVVAALLLAGFVVIVGPDASVQRAAVMASVLLISNFGGRRGSALPALGAAILVLLIDDPWQALQPGFALSVAATAGILLFGTGLAAWLHRVASLPRVIALPLAIAVTAQCACAPLLLLLQPGLPIVGVVANLIATPAAPVGTGLGLIAALLSPLVPDLAHFALLAASLPARWVAATAEVTAALPFGRWPWPEGWAGATLLAVCELTLMSAWGLHRGQLGLPWLGKRQPRTPWQLSRPAPRPLGALIASMTSVAVACIVSVSIVTPISEHVLTPSNWSVVACDVGQGDALLLRDPEQPTEIMLVDTGDDPELLNECLARFGVRDIALLVLSHDDQDHVGALGAVVSRTRAALISPTPSGEATEGREVVRRLEAAGVPFEIGLAGAAGAASLLPSPGLRWEVLAPSAQSSPPDTNAASLVMRVAVGEATVLLLGDTGYDEQASLLRSSVGLGADVVKVAHHGSRDQDPALYEAASPAWALISVGSDNDYGHPARETLLALQSSGAQVLRTDHFGHVALVPAADGTLRPWLEHGEQ